MTSALTEQVWNYALSTYVVLGLVIALLSEEHSVTTKVVVGLILLLILYLLILYWTLQPLYTALHSTIQLVKEPPLQGGIGRGRTCVEYCNLNLIDRYLYEGP